MHADIQTHKAVMHTYIQRHRHGPKGAGRLTDRYTLQLQTDRQSDRGRVDRAISQTDRNTYIHTGRQRDRHTGKQTVRQTYIQAYIHTYIHAYIHKHKPSYIQIDRNKIHNTTTGNQAYMQTYAHTV